MSFAAEILHDIPLAAHMGLKCVREASLSNSSAEWILPIEKNTNHLGTMFGGSLYCASAVSCYSVVLFLKQNAGWNTKNVVIAEGKIRYLAPVLTEARVVASVESQDLWQGSRVKIKMKAEVFCGPKLCATFEGLYMIQGSFSKGAT